MQGLVWHGCASHWGMGGSAGWRWDFKRGDPDRTIENTHTLMNKQTDSGKEVTPSEAEANWTVANQTSA